MPCEAGLREEDDLIGVTAECSAPWPQVQPCPALAPCPIPCQVWCLSSESPPCPPAVRTRGHTKSTEGRQPHQPLPQPNRAAAKALSIQPANPSHHPEQPHLEHSCTAWYSPLSSMPAPSYPQPYTFPSHYPLITCTGSFIVLILLPFHHPCQNPPITSPTPSHPSTLSYCLYWYPPITHPSTLPSY